MKSNTEKFAGGDYTYTCETFSEVNGRSIQACTSHVLGQNFAKMFDVKFQDKNQQSQFVHQTSWGFSTRSLGAFVMIHSDNKGLVLTPACADIQVRIIPIYFKDSTQKVNDKVDEIFSELKKAGIRVDVDDRENYSPGFRYNSQEILGIPIRLEFGPKDLDNNEIKLVRRYDGEKRQVSLDGLADTLKAEFKVISNLMYNNASAKFEARKKTADNWTDFMAHLNNKNIVLTPWCGIDEEEDKVKARTAIESKQVEGEGDSGLTGKAKTLCKPLGQAAPPEGTKCFFTGLPAKEYIFWGRSY